MACRLMSYASSLIVVACLSIASTALAQALRDPTRPPAAGANAVAGKVEQSGWILQSVLISPVRRYAIINGEVVALGGSIAGAELLSIAAERVTLRTREGLRVVYLFPDVTRLGLADAGSGETKRMPAPDAEQSTKAKRSGSAGINK